MAYLYKNMVRGSNRNSDKGFLRQCANVVLVILCSLSGASTLAEDTDILSSAQHEALDLPFSEAVVAGGFIFLSGQIAAKPGSLDLVPGGVPSETRQVMENIKSVLESYGARMEDIVKCTVFIEDMQDWPAMNEVYVSYFPGRKPARSAVGADGIALGGSVEIECIALHVNRE